MCNECLNNENDCRIHDCRKVCNFNLCDEEENPEENCEHRKLLMFTKIFQKVQRFS